MREQKLPPDDVADGGDVFFGECDGGGTSETRGKDEAQNKIPRENGAALICHQRHCDDGKKETEEGRKEGIN